MDPIETQLGESLGVLVEHAAALSPLKLQLFFERTFGKLSYSSTYELTSGNMATVAFFAEAATTTACYTTLNQLAHEADKPQGLEAVAWISETALVTLEKKPYVKRRWTAPADSASSTEDPGSADGYVTVFWKHAEAAIRDDIQSLARSTGQLVGSFIDEKEGGRLFLRFATENAADDYHRLIVTKYVALRRDISYGSAQEYRLAEAGRRQL